MASTRDPNHDADVIVIGSGMGGLAAAGLLARLHGRKVLVLERLVYFTEAEPHPLLPGELAHKPDHYIL